MAWMTVSVRMGVNVKSTRVVYNHTHESEFVFEQDTHKGYTSDGVQWPLQLHTPMLDTQEHTYTMVVAHYKESLEWMHKTEWGTSPHRQIVVYSKGGQVPVGKWHVDDAHSGRECSGYIQYILDYWDTLSDYSYFVHGHGPTTAYHQRFYQDNQTMSGFEHNRDNQYVMRCSLARIDEMRLNHRQVLRILYTMSKYGNYSFLDTSKWSNISYALNYAYPICIGTNCCAEMLVSRDRIHSKPREFWVKLLALMKESEYNTRPNQSACDSKGHCTPMFRDACYALEHLWHVVFADPKSDRLNGPWIYELPIDTDIVSSDHNTNIDLLYTLVRACIVHKFKSNMTQPLSKVYVFTSYVDTVTKETEVYGTKEGVDKRVEQYKEKRCEMFIRDCKRRYTDVGIYTYYDNERRLDVMPVQEFITKNRDSFNSLDEFNLHFWGIHGFDKVMKYARIISGVQKGVTLDKAYISEAASGWMPLYYHYKVKEYSILDI